ncbi:MAG: hypothetical protein ACJ8AI_08840 [Rhodopila sp.]
MPNDTHIAKMIEIGPDGSDWVQVGEGHEHTDGTGFEIKVTRDIKAGTRIVCTKWEVYEERLARTLLASAARRRKEAAQGN